MPGTVSALQNVKALTFDVFGTTVDWRTSVTEELILRAYRKNTPESTIPAETKARLRSLKDEDWGRFAQEWRDSYQAFKRSFVPGTSAWKTIDEHHRDSLEELLKKWNLAELYNSSEMDSLSLVWHRLTPWDDTVDGLAAMNKLGLVTATLSNGNLAIMRDLDDFGNLGFQKFYSAETFHLYKPNPVVYQSAARELGLDTTEVAMVATHLDDLKAARGVGMRTIYVHRPQEEAWEKDDERYKEMQANVDLWVESKEGFREVAQHLAQLKQ